MAKLRASVPDTMADGDRRKARPMPAFDYSSLQPCYDPRYQDTSRAQIDVALQIVAKLVMEDPVYIPIFQRLMAERDLAEADRTAIDRAIALVALQNAMP